MRKENKPLLDSYVQHLQPQALGCQIVNIRHVRKKNEGWRRGRGARTQFPTYI